MPIFTYRAIDRFGKEVTSEIEGASYDEAIKKVRGLGYFPTQVTARKERRSGRGGAMPMASSGRTGLQLEIKIPFLGIGTVKQRQVTIFTRQLSTLIGAGLPLVRSLNVLRDQMRECAFKGIVNNLRFT